MSLPPLWIEFDHDRISLEEIKRGTTSLTTSKFKKTALDFCHDWLNGKESFELQTSGSTGTPKKIIVTRSQLIASATLSAAVLGLQKNFTALVGLDISYIAGVMMMVRALEVGMNMIMVEPTSNPLEKIDAGRTVDFTALVPLQLETILKSPHKEKLNDIKIALVGGAALHPSTIKTLEKIPCRFFATYGMTETLSHIALQQLNGINRQDYFEALPGITLDQDERGCLVIHAPHIHQHAIITNDLVALISPTQFRWLGRIDHVINTGGVKVIPEKIEVSIAMVLDVLKISSRFFVAGLPDQLLGQAVTLIMEGPPLSIQEEELLQEKLKELPDRFERPKSIRYVSGFINTDTGKINKLKTIKLLEASNSFPTSSIAEEG
jgi:o-succinylbenzoate---CoA ligase